MSPYCWHAFFVYVTLKKLPYPVNNRRQTNEKVYQIAYCILKLFILVA